MRPIKEVEYAFFGCLFDNAPFSILEAIEMKCKREWFTLDECQLVWAAIESINGTGGIEAFAIPVLWQEVSRLVHKRKSEFSNVKFNPSDFFDESVKYRKEEEKDLSALADILRNGMISRKTRELCQLELAKLDDAKDASSAVASLAGRMTGIVNEEAQTQDVSTTDLVDNMMGQFKTAYQEYAVNKNYDYSGPGLQTPWDAMNKKFGNFEEGYNLVAARPSVGKTSFVLQLMVYWWQLGYKCAFNCLDMACSQIIKRPTMNLAQLNLTRANRGMLTEEEFHRLKAAALTIKEWDKKGIIKFREDYDVDKFIAWCKLQKTMGKLDVVVIDYIQQMTIRGVEGNENAKLTEISKRLKNFANTNKIPFIILSQLSRDNVKDKNGEREPRIEDLRGSGSLEQDAFTVTLLHRDKACQAALRNPLNSDGMMLVPQESDMEAMTHTFQSLDTIWVIRAKAQNGGLGRLPMIVYNSSFKWFVGDVNAEPSPKPLPQDFGKFSSLTADWRFNEEPFLTAEKNGKAVFPKYWELMAERICKKFGMEIPDSLREKRMAYDNRHTRQTDIADFNEPTDPEVDVVVEAQQEPIPAPAQPSGNQGADFDDAPHGGENGIEMEEVDETDTPF